MSPVCFERKLIELLPRLRRFARGLTRDVHQGDDLCQAAIERALVARDQWQDGTRLDSWMYRITRNLWIDDRRASARRVAVCAIDDDTVQIAGDGEAQMQSSLGLHDVDQAMAELPDEQREVVLLVLVEGYAYREAADILDVPIGTVTSRLARGRETLMHRLGATA